VRDRLLLYANFPDGLTPAEMADGVRRHGLAGLKITPFPEPVLAVDARHPTLAAAIAETEAVRAAVGPDVRLAIDVHGRLSPSMAVVYARAVEPLDIWFLEEPALPEDVSGLAEVAAKTSIPVAAGERVLTRQAFAELLAARAVSLVQPDLAHCGGIFEGRLVAAMAEPRQIGFAPHNPMSAVNTMASAHVSLTSPNFVALEHKLGDAAWAHEVAAPDAQVVDGHLVLGTRPGLGVELDLDACRAHPPQARELTLPRHRDGTLAER
jgi:galactonate dehydratase